jgi:dipeptidyl aminopeptidase/acylaminoacyl peptidase
MSTHSSTSFTVRDLVAMGRVGVVMPAPCGTWAAVEVARIDEEGAKYVTDLWRVPVDGSTTAPIQLTDGESNDRAPGFRADGALGFLSNRKHDADEDDKPMIQIWCIPASGDDPVCLTNAPLGVTAFRFAAAADCLVWTASHLPGVADDAQRATQRAQGKAGTSARHYRTMPVRWWDQWLGPAVSALYIADGQGNDPRPITPEAELRSLHETEIQVSPDGQQVALIWKRPGIDRVPDAVLRVIDLTTGATRSLGDRPRVGHEHIRFSPDGGHIAAARHERQDQVLGAVELVVYDLHSGEEAIIGGDWIDWPEPVGWSADGAHIVLRMQINGRADVFSVCVDTGEVRPVCVQQGCHDGLVVAGDHVFGRHHALLEAPAPFVAPLASPSTGQRIADLARTPPDLTNLAQWTEFTVPADDGTPIQSILVTPSGPGPHPVLFWVHGGPISHFADWWHWRWNPLVFVERGYAVLLPNPRGSRGFGQAFIEGIWNNEWGAACFQDLMRVADALEQRPELDTARMGAMGASFGGYMMNWFGGHTDRFRCIVTHAGIFDMSAFYGTTDLPAFWNLEMGGSPYSDPDRHDRYSPHRFVGNWITPTLVVHGEKDYRCPIGDGLSLFEALQLQGVPSELLVFPDENHWIQRPPNIIVWHDAIIDFLDRHL